MIFPLFLSDTIPEARWETIISLKIKKICCTINFTEICAIILEKKTVLNYYSGKLGLVNYYM